MVSRPPHTALALSPRTVAAAGPGCAGFARVFPLFLLVGFGALVFTGLMRQGFLGPSEAFSEASGLQRWHLMLMVALLVILVAFQIRRVVMAVSRLQDPGVLSDPLRWKLPDLKGRLPGAARKPVESSAPAGGARRDPYQCPACGARIREGDEVSPKGDVKCPYCAGWFNIHGA